MERFGHNGKMLRVDLTARTLSDEEVPESLYRKYLGGGALAAYYLLKELKPGVDPLGPENLLVFMASAVTGTPALGFSRFTVAARSPLTGAFGEAEAGGWWGPELKFAGYDGILITGKADKPVYLWIKDGKAEIRDASGLWGQMALETQQAIRHELGDPKIRVALIGPGGEKLVKYACVINELKHANGRTGMGAVMGSKNLKAIAVRGDKKMALFDAEKVKGVIKDVLGDFKTLPGSMGDLGTARGVLSLSAGGILPTRNFREGTFEKAEEISGEAMKETILVGRGTCYACAVRCKREVKVDEPYKVDPIYGGPEYETIGALGSLCGIGDLKAIAMGNQLCGAYTIDTISAGTTIAFAMECFEKGIITAEETGGIDLRFGNADAMLKMVEMIGKREGIGDILAEGVMRAAKKFGKGAEQYAMHVKGEELPMHEPRGKTGLGLAYALSPTGADHVEAPHDPAFATEAGLKPFLPFGLVEPVPSLDLSSKKVRSFAYLQQYWTLSNCIGVCIFTIVPIGPMGVTQLVDYVNHTTGWDTSLWELMKVSERQAAMARIFNLREGFTAKDDTLPDRIFSPMEGGTLKGTGIDRKVFAEAIATYYKMMGWDESGVPTRAKLEELDLDWLREHAKS